MKKLVKVLLVAGVAGMGVYGAIKVRRLKDLTLVCRVMGITEKLMEDENYEITDKDIEEIVSGYEHMTGRDAYKDFKKMFTKVEEVEVVEETTVAEEK